MKPIYIFDLDGTLALIEHRLHYIKRPSLKCLDVSWKADWRGFFAAVSDDKPNEPVIRLLRTLRSKSEIWIWSGRSDECRAQTIDWLYKNGCITRWQSLNPFSCPEQFRMRKAGDYRDDVVVKSEWLAEIEPPEYKRLTAVFDDRDRVVQMWRDAGIMCCQVASGDF
jgi:hypothetical protein